MASPGIFTRAKKRRAKDGESEKSEDITDKYIKDILKNKNVIEDICGTSGSTEISSRGTQYEKLAKQIEDYTWVQCDNVDCQKWRQIPKTVAEQLNDDSQWYCYMNSDKKYNSCAKPEEDYTAYDKLAKKLGYKYVMSQLTEGALVWAKMHGYCRHFPASCFDELIMWPGIVTKDPITEFYTDVDYDNNPTHYHVEYLGKGHSHAWISAANITLYGHKEDKSSEAKSNKKGRGKKKPHSAKASRKKYRQTLVDEAIQEAESFMNLSVEERLKQIRFTVKQKKKMDIQIKTEPTDDQDISEKDKVKQAYKLSLSKLKNPQLIDVTNKTAVNHRVSKVKNTKKNQNKSSNVVNTIQSYSHEGHMNEKANINMDVNKQNKYNKGNNCDMKSFTAHSVKKEIPGILSEGTLVLAKLDGYDKWPAVITRDSNGLHCEVSCNGIPSTYHVEFLGPSHSHAWIKVDKVSTYDKSQVDNTLLSPKRGSKNKLKKTLTSPKTTPSRAMRLKLEKAVDEAERLMLASEEDRLRQCKYRYLTGNLDDLHYGDSGFESFNYPASSASAASSVEQFECSKLNYNSSLVDKSKEERFKIDVEMYKKNEKAFLHDLSRFMKRNNVSVRLTANWHHVHVGAFQLFLAVHERGGFQQVCRKKLWTSVFRELTETMYPAGVAPKNFYLRNIYPYELYVTGGDYETEIKKLQTRNRKNSMADVMIEDDAGSFTNVDGDDSDDLSAILEDLEEYSTLCQLEEDIEAEKKRMGINIAFHDESPFTKVSPGVKMYGTPSEFNSPRSKARNQQLVPGSMFSFSSGESKNELIFHQMQRIVEDDLL